MRRLMSILVLVASLPSPASAANPTSDRYRRSYAHEAKGELVEALADIDGLSREQRTTYVYQLRRGWLLYLLGRHWDAIEAYRAAIDLRPRAVEPRLGLMLPVMALRLWLDAIEVGKAVTKIDPLNYTAISRMAWSAYSLGRHVEAERLYRKLVEAYPSDVEMRTGLGWSLLGQRRFVEAREVFDAVLVFAPDHASAKEGRAMAVAGGD